MVKANKNYNCMKIKKWLSSLLKTLGKKSKRFFCLLDKLKQNSNTTYRGDDDGKME